MLAQKNSCIGNHNVQKQICDIAGSMKQTKEPLEYRKRTFERDWKNLDFHNEENLFYKVLGKSIFRCSCSPHEHAQNLHMFLRPVLGSRVQKQQMHNLLIYQSIFWEIVSGGVQ
jgi:hypothetical protein